MGDVRFNPDATIDPIRWGRPQYDGPALRALTCLRRFSCVRSEGLSRLITLDLDFTADHAGAPCQDLWEESSGRHYYTMLAQYGALRAGALWAAESGDADRAARYSAIAEQMGQSLEAFATPDGTYRPSLDTRREKTLDTCVILAALHAGLDHGRHSARDPRLHATLAALEHQFDTAYRINRAREPGIGIAFGRYIGDRYIGAGPWYLCSFAAAEFRYRSASGAGDAESAELIASGDAILRQVRWTVPESGELSEQFSPEDGRQLSARQLGWSHAAFLTAARARQQALDRADPRLRRT